MSKISRISSFAELTTQAPREDQSRGARLSKKGENVDAPPCDVTKCKLPDCFCSKSGKEIPGNLYVSDTPQLVVLTFDDPVNDKVMQIYDELFDGKFANNNGCPIKV